MKKIHLITGASSGMGMEFVRQLKGSVNDEEFWLIARRKEKMEALLRQEGLRGRAFGLDLTQTESFQEIKQALALEDVRIITLVNAAGYGKIGDFKDISEKDALGMVDLNCRALLAITKLSLPYLVRGSVIYQFASVAAFLPQPYFAVYAAGKAFVLSFSRALNQELKRYGIQVVAICPNPVETEFFQRAGVEKEVNLIKKIGMEPKEKVVATAIKRAKRGKDISISHYTAKTIYLISRLLPHGFVLRMEEKFLRSKV
ncbi:oxidoreductase, short chain dehydrogenase/reductase family protein [Peptostreptococcaceae bacterium oral taxon 113 str. W5053]|nr:oxidoreductase, short chain dehydrogenase/reductase family protein [Peptostreptococcaceae bacterium oral taxon 113 str. W5053]